VQVISPFGPDKDIDLAKASAWIGEIAKRTEEAGINYAIEFLPPTKIPDIATAQRVAQASGQKNVGLCVDTWHVFRGAGLASLADLDFSMVKNVQVDDGTMKPRLDDYIQDCIHYRELLGAGEFPLVDFFRKTPPTAPISVEIISDALDDIPAMERAKVQAESLERTLALV
jgi:sugar phosphate isomerase/epimerase